jgi:hypothetical protein
MAGLAGRLVENLKDGVLRLSAGDHGLALVFSFQAPASAAWRFSRADGEFVGFQKKGGRECFSYLFVMAVSRRC